MGGLRMDSEETGDGRSATRRSMLVTGGARGIGAAIAKTAAERGYDVVTVDVEPIAWSLPNVIARVASIADEAAIEAIFDEITLPDVVVNNAGIVRFGPLVDLATTDFRDVVDVNLVGTFIVARAAAR